MGSIPVGAVVTDPRGAVVARMSGVRELRFAGRDPYAGSADLLGTTPYLRRKPIRIVRSESALLESVVSAQTVEFGLRHGLRAPESVWLEV